jgi:hypothetical protein
MPLFTAPRIPPLTLLTLFLSATVCLAQDPAKQEELEKKVQDLEKQLLEIKKELQEPGRKEGDTPLGYSSPVNLDSSQWNVVERVRIDLDAKVSENMKVFVELEDARYWGSEPNAIPGAPFTMFSHSLGNLRNVDMKKGYVQFDKCLGEDLRIQIGRFNMCEGSRRFL